MCLDLFFFLTSPFLSCILGFHQELHESSDFHNLVQDKFPVAGNKSFDKIRHMISKKLSGREDLNLRHHGPEPCALPGCATPRKLYNTINKKERSAFWPTALLRDFIVIRFLPSPICRMGRCLRRSRSRCTNYHLQRIRMNRPYVRLCLLHPSSMLPRTYDSRGMWRMTCTC